MNLYTVTIGDDDWSVVARNENRALEVAQLKRSTYVRVPCFMDPVKIEYRGMVQVIDFDEDPYWIEPLVFTRDKAVAEREKKFAKDWEVTNDLPTH